MRIKVRKIDWRPADWLRDTAGLKADVKGVYIDILSLIYSDGRAIDTDDIRLFSMLGNNKTVIKRCINELITRNFIIENDGKLTNFRAENELKVVEKRIETSVENGKKGGRPSNEVKQKQSLKKPDALQNGKLTSNYQLTTNNYDKDFNDFWEKYGKKVHKKKTLDLYLKARKKGISQDTLLKGIQTLYLGIAEDKQNGFNRNPPSPYQWLKDERWEDEVKSETVILSNRDPHAMWRAWLKWYKEKKYWNSNWGAKPETGRCEAPKHLLREFGFEPSNQTTEKKVKDISKTKAQASTNVE
jgi:uncharacterized protein YdaU (DUF1376 family)